MRRRLVVSPDEANRYLDTAIVAPMTTKGRSYPTRIPLTFAGKAGQVVLDQIRTVDKLGLVKRLGRLDAGVAAQVSDRLRGMFAP